MVSKIKKRFGELNTTSSLIIKHGMQFSCLLISIGLLMHLLNSYSGNYSIYLSSLSKYITEAAVTITAIIMIGGLMFDYLFKKNKTEED